MRKIVLLRTPRSRAIRAHVSPLAQLLYHRLKGGRRCLRKPCPMYRPTGGNKLHPTQKPVEVLEPFIRSCCPAGGLELDRVLRVAVNAGCSNRV